MPFHYCHENLCKCGQMKAFEKNPIRLPQQRIFSVGILQPLRILSYWAHIALQLVQNRVAPSHQPVSTEQLIPFAALSTAQAHTPATTRYWRGVNAWIENRSKTRPMVTAPHRYAVSAKITSVLASRPHWHRRQEAWARILEELQP